MSEVNKSHEKRSTGRKFAEWVTLGLSVLLVLAIAGYLVYSGSREQSPHVPVEVRVLAGEVQEASGRYVVPIEVRNLGRRTLKDLKVQVTFAAPAGESNQPDEEVTLDYLAAGAAQKIYLYVHRHPKDMTVVAEPSSYRLE